MSRLLDHSGKSDLRHLRTPKPVGLDEEAAQVDAYVTRLGDGRFYGPVPTSWILGVVNTAAEKN